ncbi:hypothetical protein [Marinobacterium marinum]|uniref:Phage abortive infection protein n=1 Tax=Marinobacterium marinum TaxID=2756129 RepID=A0A7W1X0Q4_9GAMM|nr:hypothetical protein [Marinobacterium marinum]MBA4503701.1 hypothetical protein [Marinobacterium marinum]
MLRKEKILFLSAFLVAIFAASAYFLNFHSGFSSEASDWGSFGSYLAGTITIPFSVLTLYFIYKTYVTTENTLTSNLISIRTSEAHDAIREASNFVEQSLDSKVMFHGEEVTFRDLHNDLSKFKHISGLIESDHIFKHRYRISVVKPILCLYDFLNAAESQFGITPTVRFYKIRYQWIINLHNEYNLHEIHMPKFGITSKQLEDYFYNIE